MLYLHSLRLNNKRGVALIATYFLIVTLFALGTAFFSRSLSERKITEVDKENMVAANTAEAGMAIALLNIRNTANPNTLPSVAFDPLSTTPPNAAISTGDVADASRHRLCAEPLLANCTDTDSEYQVMAIPVTAGERYIITARGVAENDITRTLIVIIDATEPEDFYNNAIYSAGDVDLNGNSYLIDGDVRYYSDIDNTDNITGTVTQDGAISPLVMLDFDSLYAASAAQGNVYDQQRLDDVKNGLASFPESFYNIEPIFDETDPEIIVTEGTPNFVYIEGDLVLNGNIGTVGGFFIVAGDVLNNPSAQYDATMNGYGEIDGCIYTRGEFRINGGGGGLNILGGVWSGTESRLNGNATIEYKQEYMDAIDASGAVKPEFQTIAWREEI